jgi:hypothetical protein
VPKAAKGKKKRLQRRNKAFLESYSSPIFLFFHEKSCRFNNVFGSSHFLGKAIKESFYMEVITLFVVKGD